MGSDTVLLTTADGVTLEGDLLLADSGASVQGAGVQGAGVRGEGVHGAAVVCHPHPLFGGDRFNGVVDVVWRELASVGFHSLRFDFRGTNRSGGSHGGGATEMHDVVAAIDLLHDRTGSPVWLVGYSFGAMVALSVADPRVLGWVAIAPPLARTGDPATLPAAHDARPTMILTPEHDQFGDPATVASIVADWPTTTVEMVPMGDHSLIGRTAVVARSVAAYITADR